MNHHCCCLQCYTGTCKFSTAWGKALFVCKVLWYLHLDVTLIGTLDTTYCPSPWIDPGVQLSQGLLGSSGFSKKGWMWWFCNWLGAAAWAEVVEARSLHHCPSAEGLLPVLPCSCRMARRQGSEDGGPSWALHLPLPFSLQASFFISSLEFFS